MEDKGASVKSKHIMICLSIINEAYANGDIDLKRIKKIPSVNWFQLQFYQYLRKLVNDQTPLITDLTIPYSNEIKASNES